MEVTKRNIRTKGFLYVLYLVERQDQEKERDRVVERDSDIFRMCWNDGSVGDDDVAHRQRDQSMGDILVFSVYGCGGYFDLCVRR